MVKKMFEKTQINVRKLGIILCLITIIVTAISINDTNNSIKINDNNIPNLIITINHKENGIIINSEKIITHNTVMLSGIDWLIVHSFNTANVTEKGMYLCFSTNSTGISTAWTGVSDEVVTNGLERALASYTHNSNANVSLSKTFTATGTITGITKIALCYTDVANCGYDLIAIAELSPSINVGANDTVITQWINTGST